MNIDIIYPKYIKKFQNFYSDYLKDRIDQIFSFYSKHFTQHKRRQLIQQDNYIYNAVKYIKLAFIEYKRVSNFHIDTEKVEYSLSFNTTSGPQFQLYTHIPSFCLSIGFNQQPQSILTHQQ